MTRKHALFAIGALTALRLIWLLFNFPELYADEAQYWGWAQHFAFGYFSKPPLIAWLIGAGTWLVGDTEAGVRLWMPLLHGGVAFMLMQAGHALFGERTGAWAGVVYATLPAVFASATTASTDAPLLFFWALALLAVLRIRAGAGFVWWCVLGAALGMGMLAKYAMAMFVPSLVLLAVFDADLRRHARPAGLAAALALMLAVMAPNIAWNLANGMATVRHVGANANLSGGPHFGLRSGLEFIGAQFAVFGPLLFAVLLVCFATVRRLWTDARLRLLVLFAAPLLLIMTAEAFVSRANANWAAAAYVAATLLVVAWCVQRGREWILKASVVLHVIAGVVMLVGPGVAATAGYPLPRHLDPWARQRGQAQLGRMIGQTWMQNPDTRLLFDQRRDMASMLFYVHPHPLDALMWNDSGVAGNQYELESPLRAGDTQPLLWVTRRAEVADVLARFTNATQISALTIWTHPGASVRYRIYRLEGFRGY